MLVFFWISVLFPPPGGASQNGDYNVCCRHHWCWELAWSWWWSERIQKPRQVDYKSKEHEIREIQLGNLSILKAYQTDNKRESKHRISINLFPNLTFANVGRWLQAFCFLGQWTTPWRSHFEQQGCAKNSCPWTLGASGRAGTASLLSRQSFWTNQVVLLTFHMSRDRVKSLPIPGDKEFTGEWTKYN